MTKQQASQAVKDMAQIWGAKHIRGFNAEEVLTAVNITNELIKFIDALPEEPKPE